MRGSDFWLPVFGNNRPVTVEIGPGRGEFLLAVARANPACNFCGIEHSRRRVLEIQRKIDTGNLTNVRIVGADATCLLQLLPDACVAAYILQFPDPWWKRRHHRRRLFTDTFVATLVRTLEPGGTIALTTDVEEYFALAQGLLDAHVGLDRVPGPRAHDGQTSFARKASARKAAVHVSVHRRAVEA